MLLSPRLRLVLSITLTWFVIFAVLRVAFFWWFLAGQGLDSGEAWQAFGIGLRFDLRIALLIALPVVLLSLLPGHFGLRTGRISRALAVLWMALAGMAVALTYVADWAHYSYLEERLNASVLRFFQNSGDSLRMVWESYPVIPLVLLLIAGALFGAWLGARVVRMFVQRPRPRRGWLRGTVAVVACTYLYALGIMGQFGEVPLRWSDAYFASNQQIASLGLNPAVFFYDTLIAGTREHDEGLLEERYRRVADYLGVDHPDPKTLDFSRKVAGHDTGRTRPPNVVFIHLESLGANRVGLFGNPMDATPNVDNFGRHGYFFPNFMVPASGTARTVFGLVTGIPDVSWGGSTASRNPQIVDQYTLVNSFKNYQRLYFIGGSAGWANIGGLLKNNIKDLELWEAGDYDAPAVDVWGISDRDLFKAAHRRLDALDPDKPFVAFIQTAGNHRPFTIPEDDSEFEVNNPPEGEVQKHSFLGNDQYNAVRLLDYNVGYYINQLAAHSHYADNTIYIMYGDHNDRSSTSQHMGYSEALQLDKHHVPMIIYGPGVLGEPRVIEHPASLVDLMPTALGITGLPYENRTLGRDLLNTEEPFYALTFGGNRSQRPLIGLLGKDYHLGMYYNGENTRLYDLEHPDLEAPVNDQHPDITADRKAMLEGLYQAARYMFHHNKP
ncbi:alkaline phosphatase [Alcanivorax sp. N3-2A]|nr:alkaline phosphatase [Alcanivorax sp. N3-2A]|tara:strand:- start:8909 stop:10909 length:2001 start_codon:yes stop_codon:yes gene_type:complete